jgi:hypothetical protein
MMNATPGGRNARQEALVENHCPGCLTIEIESCTAPDGTEDIFLTVCFYDEDYDLMGGKLWVGLRQGTLQFDIRGAKMKAKDRYGAKWSTSLTTEITSELVRETQSGGTFSVAGTSISPGVSGTSKSSHKTIETETRSILKVYTYGTSSKPRWAFIEPVRGKPLRGVLQDIQLGKLNIPTPASNDVTKEGIANAMPWIIDIRFIFDIRDIVLGGSGGFWGKNIGKNKLAVIERAIVKHLLKNRLKSPISEGILKGQLPIKNTSV